MSTAKKIDIPVLMQAKPGIVLELDMAEANTLLTILQFIGGDPEHSRCGHSARISASLSAAGAKYNAADVVREHGQSNGVTFSDYIKVPE